MFQGLYGPEVSTICEWLPSTGRYYFLPILPVHSSSDMQALFPEGIQAADYQDLLATAEKRKALFDARYPLEEEGDAWVVHFGSRWFLANPRENQDSPVTFRLALATPPGSVLEGTLEAHTFAIVVEGESVLRIHLSNYRTDSDNGVWDNPEFTQEDPWTWFYGDYLVHPDDEETRRTTLILHASLKAEPDVEVQVTGQGTVTPEFDANAGTMTLRVDHNGVVELGIPVP